MLLNEIKTIKRQMSDGTFAHEFDEYGTLNTKEYKTGIHTVNIHLQKEELMLFNRYKLPTPPASIPVLFAFTLDKSPIGDEEKAHAAGIMDAIKQRGQNHTMSNAEIEKFTRTGLKRVINHQLPTNDKRSPRDVQYSAIQKMFSRLRDNRFHENDRGNIVLVTLSSSSPVVSQFANIISEYLGGVNIIQGAFIKNNWPRLSNYVYSGGMYVPRVKRDAELGTRGDRSSSPHNKLKEYKRTIKHLKSHIVQLNNSEFSSMEELDMTHRELTKAERKLGILTRRIADNKFHIHTAIAPDMIDRDKGFYNYQLAVKDIASQLIGKDIIFIDDNVVSGKSIADAIKSLYKLQVVPQSMIGFCPHKLINSAKSKNVVTGEQIYKTPNKKVIYND